MLQSLPIQESAQCHNGMGYKYNFVLLNCQSVINEMQTIQLEIANKDIALCALTETWIKEDDNLTPLHICLTGYKSVSIPKSVKTGGFALVHKKSINVTSRKCKSYNMMEYAEFTISIPNKTIQLGLLYWPPERSILQFGQDLENYREVNINELGECVLLGNLNIHVNKKDDQIQWHSLIHSRVLACRTGLNFNT